MHTDDRPAPLSWPALPDEAAVTLHHVLNDFLMLFESQYCVQIERYYRERSRENLVQPDFVQPDLFHSANPDDPPFCRSPAQYKTPPASLPGGVAIWRHTSDDHHAM